MATVVNVNGTNYTVTAADLTTDYITATLDATAADPCPTWSTIRRVMLRL